MASGSESEKTARAQGARSFAQRQADLFSTDFSFSGYERDLMALNLGNGRFLNISGISGADSVTDGRGSVFADFDNDGDSDIFLRSMHGSAHQLFRNNVGQDLNFIRIALRGTRSGRDAYGTTVRVKTSQGLLTQVKSGGAGFLSQPDPRLLFGLGRSDRAESIEVLWPSGQRQRFTGAEAGASLLLVEGRPDAQPVREQRFSLPDPLSPIEKRFKLLRIRPEQALPALSVLELDGTKKPLASLLKQGRPVLINFWATWCQGCVTEMPELQRLSAETSPKAPRVIGISVDKADARPKIPAFVKRLGVTYPVYCIDPKELAKLFATKDPGLPLSILLDEELRVMDLFQGWSLQTRKRLHRWTHATQSP